ncbi:unnamed protein product [Soboliphyme baturini]|uniref:3-oxoacyl-[acyl-carrier-protein] reductase FabG-like n=1 Tax=Soboliphyme baturini TaxID=241478 RepID=A0A183J004_9BILA|nr:unnamed protein product [Soboliphyme baturini]
MNLSTAQIGASSGIGRACAEHFASLGCFLSISGRNEERLKAVAQNCVQKGLDSDKVLSTRADITRKEDLKCLVDSTKRHFGKINILVNNAGILVRGSVADCPIEEYDRVMNTNVRAMISLTQLCIPDLIRSKGSIVNVSSINGPCAFAGVAYYCISKAAVDQFTKCLALEMAPHGVRVNAVNPGVVKTDLQKAFIEHSKETHALGRVGESIEVAKAVAFLASDDASFTTGNLFRIDGGRGLMVPR